MKTSALVRIIIWAFVALFLTSFLVFSLTNHGFNFIPWINLGGFGQYTYANESQYSIGNSEISSEISDIEIHWIAGSVKIEPYDGSTVSLKETVSGGTDEDELMRWKVEDGKLTVQYRKSGWKIFSSDTGKTLVIKIPAAMASELVTVKINTTSADTDISGIVCIKLGADTVSGNIKIKNVKTTELSCDTVSGQLNSTETEAESIACDTVSGGISASGSFGKIDCESVSGDMTIYDTVCPSSADFDSVSGSIKLYVPENDGFTANTNTVSGDFTCGFPATINKKNAVYKNGEVKLDFETVSGNISVINISEAN